MDFLEADATPHIPHPARNRGDGPVFGVLAIGIFVVATQSYALWHARELDGQTREWQASVVQRERDLKSVADAVAEKEKANQSEAVVLEQTRAELTRLKAERDRALAEGSKAQRDLELIRQDLTKAIGDRDAAGLKTTSAKAELTLIEERTTALMTLESDLKAEVARWQAQRDQVSKSFGDEQAELAKVTVNLTSARKQLADAEKQSAEARKQLADLQTSITKAATDLQTAITEQGKSARHREQLLADAQAAELRVSDAQKIEVSLQASIKALMAANDTMVLDKTEVERLKAEKTQLTKDVAMLAADHSAASQMLATAQTQAGTLQARLKELQAAITKAGDDLLTSATEHGRLTQQRNALQTEVADMEKRVAAAKKAEEALLMSGKELAAANEQMKIDKDEIARLKAERDQLIKSVAEDKAALTSQSDELKLTTALLGSTQKTVQALQAKIKELQAANTSLAIDYEEAVTDHGKVLRQRESLLSEIAAAEQRQATLKKEEETMTAALRDIRKTLQQLGLTKADQEKAVSELETKLSDLQSDLATRTKELVTLQKKLAESRLGEVSSATPAEKSESATEADKNQPSNDTDGKTDK